MRIDYDSDADILVVTLSDAEIVDTEEEPEGVIVDYDEAGNVVSVEILDASKRVALPPAWSYEKVA